jgi:hypothetical protein
MSATQVEQQVFVFFSNICSGPALARWRARCTTPTYNSLSSDARPQSIPGKNEKFALSLRPPYSQWTGEIYCAKTQIASHFKRDPKNRKSRLKLLSNSCSEISANFHVCARRKYSPLNTHSRLFSTAELFLNLTATLSELEKQLEQICELKYTML